MSVHYLQLRRISSFDKCAIIRVVISENTWCPHMASGGFARRGFGMGYCRTVQEGSMDLAVLRCCFSRFGLVGGDLSSCGIWPSCLSYDIYIYFPARGKRSTTFFSRLGFGVPILVLHHLSRCKITFNYNAQLKTITSQCVEWPSFVSWNPRNELPDRTLSRRASAGQYPCCGNPDYLTVDLTGSNPVGQACLPCWKNP